VIPGGISGISNTFFSESTEIPLEDMIGGGVSGISSISNTF